VARGGGGTAAAGSAGALSAPLPLRIE